MRRKVWVTWIASLAALGWLGIMGLHAASLSTADSVAASVAFLAQRQDEFHNRFPVYDDVSSAGNHFPAFAKIGRDANVVATVNGSWANNPHSGASCMRFQFTPRDNLDYGGFYLLNGVLAGSAPVANFGDTPNAGIDLRGAQQLSFWARGEAGGEVIDFVVAGVGRNPDTGVATAPYPDSSPRKKLNVTLSTVWTKYSIDVSAMNLSYVLGGFGWSTAARPNAAPITFYVDDVQFELNTAAVADRLGQPRFIRSYLTADAQPDLSNASRNKDSDFDLVLRNSAYAYDNALALLAFLAERSADSLRRARLIGDAFLYALSHDRTFGNDRVRSDYAAGDIALPPGWVANGKAGTVPVAGFYDESKGQFFEVGQGSVDTGNNAWVLTALVALHRATGDNKYLDAAGRIGNFIRTQFAGAGSYPGFLGGLESAESALPVQRGYASVEHNLDIGAAFTLMAGAGIDKSWLVDATKAQQFVDSQFDTATGCYLSGTTDANHRNSSAFQLPVDVQAWSILSPGGAAASRHGALMDCAKNRHFATLDGYSGYDFNNDRDGVWFEGSGHVAVAALLAGRLAEADALRTMLRAAQAAAGFGDGGGLPAASHDGVSTGFNADASGPGACATDPMQCTFKLFKRKHIGATAWNVFAQLGFNPYTQTIVAPLVPAASIKTTPVGPLAGGSVSFDASGSTAPAGRSITGYLWQITDGAGIASFSSATNAATATLATSGPGNVTVVLTVTDSAGAVATTSSTIAVAALPTVVIKAAPDKPTAGAIVTIDGSGSSASGGRTIAGYQWTVVTGGTLASISGSATGSTVSIVTSAAGTFEIQLSITDSAGSSAANKLNLVVAEPPAKDGGGAASPGWLLLLGAAILLLTACRQRDGGQRSEPN